MAQAARLRHPEAVVECLDVLSDSPGGFSAVYSSTYLLLVRHLSWVWRLSYALLDQDAIYRFVQPVRQRWNFWIARRLVDRLKTTRPDVVLVTHFLPADVCSAGRAQGWLQAPVVVVVTDLHPHWFWISSHADAVVAATPESVALLQRRGVVPSRIHLAGIPIDPAFGRPVDRTTVLAQLQLSMDRLTVLVTSGGTTVGNFNRVVQALVDLEPRWPGRLQLIVVCGQDAMAQARWTQAAASSRMPMRVFGFIDRMAELMGVSDLIVTKAGGLTVSEALARELPLILSHVIPGQERLNAAYVVRHGAGIIAPTPRQVSAAVVRLLQDPEQRTAMRHAAKQLGGAGAAARIVADVMDPLLACTPRRS